MNQQAFHLNRRQFLTGAMAGSMVVAAGALGNPSRLKAAPSEGIDPTPETNHNLLYKTPWNSQEAGETAPFSLPALPYSQDALSPYITAETIGFHYGKHHRGYVRKINGLTEKNEYTGCTLEQIIRQTAGRKTTDQTNIYNNAAQVWNHTFYWRSMTPGGGGTPEGALPEKIASDFGTFDNFRTAFKTMAASHFGSGWAWLVYDKGTLTIEKTANADTPLAHGRVPLLTIDVWEHAYYLDYQNRRTEYIDTWFDHLVNWGFAEKNYSAAIG